MAGRNFQNQHVVALFGWPAKEFDGGHAIGVVKTETSYIIYDNDSIFEFKNSNVFIKKFGIDAICLRLFKDRYAPDKKQCSFEIKKHEIKNYLLNSTDIELDDDECWHLYGFTKPMNKVYEFLENESKVNPGFKKLKIKQVFEYLKDQAKANPGLKKPKPKPSSN